MRVLRELRRWRLSRRPQCFEFEIMLCFVRMLWIWNYQSTGNQVPHSQTKQITGICLANELDLTLYVKEKKQETRSDDRRHFHALHLRKIKIQTGLWLRSEEWRHKNTNLIKIDKREFRKRCLQENTKLTRKDTDSYLWTCNEDRKLATVKWIEQDSKSYSIAFDSR